MFTKKQSQDSASHTSFSNKRRFLYLFCIGGALLAAIGLNRHTLKEVYLENITPNKANATEFLPAFGCDNTPNSKCIDFGAANEESGGIEYTHTAMTTIITDGVTSYRSVKPQQTLTVSFPSFNTDTNGLPLTPMLLEVQYKDVIDDGTTTSGDLLETSHRIFVQSHIDYTNPDPLITNQDKEIYTVASLGGRNDSTWKYTQYVFQKTPFQLLHAINGKFIIQFQMPDLSVDDESLYFPIDYISLRVISNNEATMALSDERQLRGFYETPLPPDIPSPPITYSNPDLTVFVRDIMKPIYTHTQPQLAEIDQDISFSSALGEVESANFGIYSRSGIDNLAFAISDIENVAAHSNIPKENISIFRVVPDFKRLTLYAGAYAKSYGFMPDRLEYIQTLSIAPNTSERIWLKIHIPSNMPGGIYTGHVNIIQQGTILKQVDIKADVLPIALDMPENINPVYHDPYTKVYSSDTEEVFRLYQETGFDLFNFKTINASLDSSGNIVFDTKLFEQRLDNMKQEGFAKKIAIYSASYVQIHKLLFPDADPHYLYTNLSDPRFVKAFASHVQTISNIGNERGIEFIFDVIDEPGVDPYKRIVADRLFTIIKNNNLKTTVTYYPECDKPLAIDTSQFALPPELHQTLPPLTNLVDYKVWTLGIGNKDEGFARQYPNYGYYTTVTSFLRDPIYNRFLHGLFAFRTDAKVVSAYAMGDLVGDPFDDFDAQANYVFPFTLPDFLFAYPTWSGELLPAMNLEGIREGINDAKYIATLKRLIRQNPQSPIASEANNYLSSLKQNISPSFYADYESRTSEIGYSQEILRQISATNSPTDYEAFTRIRSTLIGYIARLIPTLFIPIIFNNSALHGK